MLDEGSSNIFWDRISERARDTIDAFKEGRQPRVVRYCVHATSNCNMSCTYCREKKSNAVIDRSLFRNICLAAGQSGIVHVTGGEPSLVPWMEEEIYNQRDITRFAWNTNLLIMPKKETLYSIFRLKTSLDDDHADRWNEMVGGKYFDTVVENIKKCSEIVKYTSVCYTATHRNAYRLDNFIRFCQQEFPNLFSISVSFYKGRNPFMKLTKEDVVLLFQHSDLLNPVSKQVFTETHSLQGNYFPENLEIPCYLSLTERLYDEYGREFYCSHLYRDKVKPPGRPGKDCHCVSGCNLRFNKFNKQIHEVVCKLRENKNE